MCAEVSCIKITCCKSCFLFLQGARNQGPTRLRQGETTEDLHSDKAFSGWTESDTVLALHTFGQFLLILIILVIYVNCNQW